MVHGLAVAATVLPPTVMLAGLVVRTAALRLAPHGRLAGYDRRSRFHPGGVAVVLATLGAAGAAPLLGVGGLGKETAVLVVASAAMALLGAVDDVWPLGTRMRLVVASPAALAVVVASGLGPWPGVLAVVWIVFLTNAFGPRGDADGATGTVAAMTALGLGACALIAGRSADALVLGVLAAALIAFLLTTRHAVRAFLGGCGSLFTGFTLGAAAVVLHVGEPAPRSAAELFALNAVVLADACVVTLSRRCAGRPLLHGARDHIAHRLRRVGLTPRGVAVVLGGVSLIGTLHVLLLQGGWLAPAAVLPLVGADLAAVVLLLGVPVYGAAARGEVPRGGAGHVPHQTYATPSLVGSVRMPPVDASFTGRTETIAGRRREE
ncbi:MraY family glycosyltransferase [Streptomyces melanogenes]|uniref:MraY family glycosyltransferase n=1 Tax=Streptomyces melanogenes TaxID=67326 RepID=UPI00167E4163|nr:MraY family glycosyltransferase [Streptomyces melanogenes]GGP86184.1 putative glycosyltransferase [Streptomyces melanogenes]